MNRRDLLRTGLAASGSGLLNRKLRGDDSLQQFLCPPDGTPPDLLSRPSPPSRPFVTPLNISPVKQPVQALDPPPDPRAHQLWTEHIPKVFYEIHEQEFKWKYHVDPPFANGSWGWGFDGVTPGPTYHARYGEPVLVRRFNNLPPVNRSNVGFALPSTTSHLHNAHTASESDGEPQDWIDAGEFWDHHYCNFPSNNRPEEKLSTLWYHDHRLDFTATNVYAGLAGFYLLFDEWDSGNENDTSPTASRLPSGKYDIPMLLHDVLFDPAGQVVFDPFNTDGILGDKYTVNRTIQPFLQVERRKYRFRIANGGPSRFYELYLATRTKDQQFIVLTGDGNMLREPLKADAVYIAPAQRYDVIIDFSQFAEGDQVYLQNRLIQTNGKGPTDRKDPNPKPENSVMRFDVVGGQVTDNSRIPDRLRELPLRRREVKRRRVFNFDYRGGLWTINGKVFDPNRVDIEIERGTAEIWTLINQGKNWAHPIHSHFTEYLLLKVNGIEVDETTVESGKPATTNTAEPLTAETVVAERNREYADAPAKTGPGEFRNVKVFRGGPRRDMATLLPNDELEVYMEWHDFLGKYVMHCHNVVHEDHSMMIRWDIVQKAGPVPDTQTALKELINTTEVPHLEARPKTGTAMQDQQKARNK
jgi:FtsP/CotA-like multicopper oxidase with cupredoxin domain